MKISASIYSNKTRSLPDLVQELDACGIDLFHVDCKDDPGVFEDIAHIRTLSSTPIDLHVITDRPEAFWEGIRAQQVEYVTFQHENLSAPLNFPADLTCQKGIALTANTPVEAYAQYAAQTDFILFMTTTPGESGGSFNSNTFRRIREFRKTFPGKKVHVDGGVNAEVSFILRNMAVNASVSGSYLVDNGSIGASLARLFSPEVESHFQVGDFMLPPAELPVLQEDDLNLRAVLECIEHGRMGFCLIVNQQQQLRGLISNADVRRGLIRNMDALENLQAADLLNRNPLTVKTGDNVADLLRTVKSFEFPVLYLPVIETDGTLAGAVTFNNLIKGEL